MRSFQIFGVSILMAALSQAADITQANITSLFGKEQGFAKLDSRNSTESIAVNIDNSIDSSTYFIGGGDVFSISVEGLPAAQYRAIVSTSLDITIPELGTIVLGKITLAEAVDSLKAAIKQRLRKENRVFVALCGVKTASVSITGAIEKPGTYKLPGSSRLFDAILQANNGIVPDFHKINIREITRINHNQTETYDILSYMLRGSLLENPYLYPGDQILIKSTGRRVVVGGYIQGKIFGAVPIKQGENGYDFFSLFDLDASADSQSIQFQRPRDKSRSGIINLSDLKAITLEDADILIFQRKKNYDDFYAVTITGEVRRPGTYSISRNSTRLSDIFPLCGGLNENADKNKIALLRPASVLAGESIRLLTANQPATAARLWTIRPGISSAIATMQVGGDYTVVPIADVQSNEIILLPGDEINVPLLQYSISISGNIHQPGAYPYVKGKSVRDYIREAGGLAQRADRENLFIIRNYSSKIQIRSLDEPLAGDVIVVPESEQFRRWTIFKDIVAVLGSVASIALVTVSVLK
jgi:protein involved in polysaccharide export with SLBB domain